MVWARLLLPPAPQWAGPQSLSVAFTSSLAAAAAASRESKTCVKLQPNQEHMLIPAQSPNASTWTAHHSRNISSKTSGCSADRALLMPMPLGIVPSSLRWQSSASTENSSEGARIQPPDRSLNFFQILGVPDMQFNLDPKELDQCYKKLQWQYHPDKASSRPKQEQEWAAEHATAINHAYSTLRNPLARGTYMLARLGINVDGEDAGTISNPELLMEIMESREEVETTSDASHLHALLNKNREKLSSLFSKLSKCFEVNDLQAAKDIATELIYLDRLEEAIKEKLPTAA
ncbi:hypothetical protein DUNSADRAFT_11347 [Dunaliella salina]|uniref:J domain-containing protein n=1 Tax=Dunaliella salina TaxID=3046 RepID=A0ABQ7GDM3_DUNSA|nr:hypothetical protein DUNSADRAFT_11347 [Dunaliella salina]|eukprot:KAF5832703.1 hypothetical protein DUNSADRAFT_11347 [Dunaliella salina]